MTILNASTLKLMMFRMSLLDFFRLRMALTRDDNVDGVEEVDGGILPI
jgi:hypothetical protein